MLWVLQSKLALKLEEEDSIELKREFADGQERSVWNPALPLVIRAFEFSDYELFRLRAAIEAWDVSMALQSGGFGVADRGVFLL